MVERIEKRKGRRVIFIAYNGFSDWECGYALAELASGRYFRTGSTPCAVATATPSGDSVRSMGGIRVEADAAVESMQPSAGDILLIPGGAGWETESMGGLLGLASRALDSGALVCAICGATLGLARAGLLNSRKHTSNAPEYLSLAGAAYSGTGLYADAPAVRDGNLVTASGLAPVEFAYEIFMGSGLFAADAAEAWRALNKERSPVAWNALNRAMEGER